MATPKVYISSTFFDLAAHRKALYDTLCKTRCFDVVCMEYYGTISKEPLQQCLEDVDQSHFYILLLGNRYGYIPEGHEQAITHLEYQQAIGNPENGIPDRKRCVLPFLLSPNYTLPADIEERIKTEEANDGKTLTEKKASTLTAFKSTVKKHFIVEDNGFTTPEDLCSKVMAALIPELIHRNFGSVVKNLVLKDGISNRCNRESVRNDFLYENAQSRSYFRTFVIHGEMQEMLRAFTDNLSVYELNAIKESKILNLDEGALTDKDKFIKKTCREIYKNLFNEWLQPEEQTPLAMAQKITEKEHNVVVSVIELSFDSWEMKYKSLLAPLFDAVEKANKKLNTHKACYLLFNIHHGKDQQGSPSTHKKIVLLDKLNSVNILHIAQWVRLYLYNVGDSSRAELMANMIIRHYFPEYKDDPGRRFPMEYAVERLEQVVNDFNSNEAFFADIPQLINKLNK